MKKKEILKTLPRTRAHDVRMLASRGISQQTLIASYALYKGEKLIDVGTADELARNNDVSEITIRVTASLHPSHSNARSELHL